jgi:FkbM family methyltransferase
MPVRRVRNFFRSKKIFLRVCRTNNLNLNFRLNREGMSVLYEIFGNREYADFFPFYKKSIIVDIGAHYGYFSLFAAINSDPGSRILAIEPYPANFNILSKNILQCGYKNITCIPCAVNDIPGTAPIFKGESVNNSLINNFALLNPGKESSTVETKTIEQLVDENNLSRIDFLKMDCEGSEYAIFESMPRSVSDIISTVSMEFHDLKSSHYNGEFLISRLMDLDFEIVKYQYSRTNRGLNFGKIIGTKLFRKQVKQE